MATIKEFKNWFFRRVHQPVGIKQDQEVGYPLQIEIDGNLQYQRLHKLDYPSQRSYEKLLASALFAIEWEDRAKDSDDTNYSQFGNVLGGHVTVATDNQAIGLETDLGVTLPERTEIGVNGNENRYTRVPRTSHLPTVDDVDNTTLTDFWCVLTNSNPALRTVPNPVVIDYDPAITTRNHYLAEINNNFEQWLKAIFDNLKTFLFELNIDQYTIGDWSGTAGVTYNNSANGEIIVGEEVETCDSYKKFTIGVDIKDITLENGTVSGTVGGNPVTGTIIWTETSPRTWRADITLS